MQNQYIAGQEALDRFEFMLGRFREEDSTGHVFLGVRGLDGELGLQRIDGHDQRQVDAGLHASSCEFILIDSGNSAGDSWKAMYFPLPKVYTFVYESVGCERESSGVVEPL